MASSPRTYRSGPSNPPIFADGPGTYAQVDIAAAPATVWDYVTDINLPAKFSSEFKRGEWETEGPALGAAFRGISENQHLGEWQLTSFIDRFEPVQTFGWATMNLEDPGARWWFTLTETEAGTRLRFDVTLGPGPSGLTVAITAMPDKETRIIERRLDDLHANMVATVNGIKQHAED